MDCSDGQPGYRLRPGRGLFLVEVQGHKRSRSKFRGLVSSSSRCRPNLVNRNCRKLQLRNFFSRYTTLYRTGYRLAPASTDNEAASSHRPRNKALAITTTDLKPYPAVWSSHVSASPRHHAL